VKILQQDKPMAPLPPKAISTLSPAKVADPSYSERSQRCARAQLSIAKGGNNGSTFRCKGGWCLPMEGRCNGVKNCGDNSDEEGCNNEAPVEPPLALEPTYDRQLLNACVYDFCFGGPDMVEDDMIAANLLIDDM